MARDRVIARVALVLYLLYWVAVLFGYVRVDSTDVPSGLFDPLRGAAVVLPAFALGFAVARPWAVASGLVFLVAALFPDRTVVSGTGVDVTLVGMYGVSFVDALVLVAVTTPCVVAGIAARRMWAARRAPI